MLTFIFTLKLYAQNDKTEVSRTLNNLYQQKEYAKCIEKADAFIQIYKGEKDSVYVDLLRKKALSHSYLQQGEKCAETLTLGIELYEKINKIDATLHWFYKNYCRVASCKRPEYRQYLHSYIKCDYWHYTDYFVYLESVEDIVKSMNSEERDKFITEEEKELKEINKRGFEEFFLYVKGYLLQSDKGFYANDHYLEISMNCLYSAYKKFLQLLKEDNNHVLAKLYFNTLDELATLSEIQMKFLSAASYRKKQIELSNIYWEKWGEWKFTNPWNGFSFKNQVYDNVLYMLSEYVNDNNQVGNYKEIVSMMRSIQKSKEWQLLEDDEKEYVLTTKENFEAKLFVKTKSESLNNKINWNLENKYGRACSNIENILAKNGSDEEILKIIEDVHDNDLDWYVSLCNDLLISSCRSNVIKELVADNYQADYDLVSGRTIVNPVFHYIENGEEDISICSKFINECRAGWHLSGGFLNGLETWKLLECLSKSYYREKAYEKAARAQEIALEILRSDKTNPEWIDFDNKENNEPDRTIRDVLYKEDCKASFAVKATFTNEIEGYLLLSDIYRDFGYYEKQYEFLCKAFEASNMLVCYELNMGTDSHADMVWQNDSYVYGHIMEQLPLAIEKYPKLAELAFSTSYMYQGFLMNQKNAIRTDAIEINEKNIFDYYKSSTKYRRQIENDLTEHGNIVGDKEFFYENDLYQLTKLRPSRFTLENSIVDYDFIKKNLNDNEIFVDFFTIFNDSTYTYNAVINNKQLQFTTNEGIVYAIITRKNWEIPKVVEIGRNHGNEMLSNDWNLEQYKFTNSSERISQLHNDIKFGQYCWNKIIKTANVKQNESILFVPSDFLHSYSVEYLPINSSQRMTGLYGMKRLSSSIELQNRGVYFESNDKLIAFGDLSYTGDINYDKKIKKRKKDKSLKLRRMSSTIELTDRSELDVLTGGHEEITTISKIMGEKCVCYNDQRGTKRVINNMDWDSPQFLHISTHGYNLNYAELSADEHNMVFGKRDTIYSNVEKSMYETGLYLANHNKWNIKEGIINAKEISMLNFNNTKLVVLSACSSSTGISSNNGVFGMNRGFKIAGVKSIIGSLWEVDDTATSILMTSFYTYLNQGDDAYTSLIKAQEVVKNHVGKKNERNIGSKYIYSDPYYWAGFILVDGL